MPNSPIMPGMPGGGPPDQQVQSLLQLAGTDPNSGATQDWAPSWVREQLPTNLAYFNASQGGAPTGGGGGGLSPFAAPGAPTSAGQLAPWLNPDNWGPPPAITGAREPQGWFPQEFAHGGNDPRGKFWSQKAANTAYNQVFPGSSIGNDERPNTLNWRLLGPEPGNFMVKGHPISQSKLFDDLHRWMRVQDVDAGGVVGGMVFPARDRGGLDASMWSGAGQVGFPGQMDPFWTSWGAGGPGSG